MTLRAIIFDMDGTLGDTLPFIIQALQETFQRYTGQDYSVEEIKAMFGPTEEGVITPRVPNNTGEQALQYYLDRYKALHHYAQEPFPGIIDLLKAIRKRGIKTGIVTGKGSRTAQISLETFGLAPYIDIMIPGSPQGSAKPEGITKMLEQWGIIPADAAYVGDVDSDIRDAIEAGVIPIGAMWAATSTITYTDGLLFRSVSAFQKWVEQSAEPISA